MATNRTFRGVFFRDVLAPEDESRPDKTADPEEQTVGNDIAHGQPDDEAVNVLANELWQPETRVGGPLNPSYERENGAGKPKDAAS